MLWRKSTYGEMANQTMHMSDIQLSVAGQFKIQFSKKTLDK